MDLFKQVMIAAPLAMAAAVQPGPFGAFLMSEAARRGIRPTFIMAFAPLISDLPVLIIVLLFYPLIPSAALDLLQVAGGLLLLYLAYSGFVAASNPIDTTTGGEEGAGFWQASLINLLSPGPYVFWGTVGGPLLIAAWQDSLFSGASFLAAFYLSFISGLIGLMALFSLTRRAGSHATTWVVRIMALVLLGFGVYLIVTGIKALIGFV